MSVASIARPVILVGRNNGVGLTSDAALIRRALEGDREVRYFGARSVPLAGFLFNRDRLRDAVIVFIERVHALWLPFGKRHVIIPNQERFPRRQLWRLRHVDAVFCKSQDAEGIFSHFHRNAVFTGFTSCDNLDRTIQPDYGAAFHLAGRSSFKGTQELLDVWAGHPHWPQLTVVAHPTSPWDSRGAANVLMIRQILPHAEIARLQNACGLHICPSLAEGWGHYIAEGAACRALVMTTDGPPMNELISESRGCLIRSDCVGERHLGRMFRPQAGALEESMEKVLAMSEGERRSLGQAARSWFEENDRAFSERLRAAIGRFDD